MLFENIRGHRDTHGRRVLVNDTSHSIAKAFLALAQGRPELVKRIVASLLEGAHFINANPSWAIRKLQSEYAYTEAEAKLVYAELRYASKDGRISAKMVENAREFLIEYGLVPRDKMPAAKDLFTNDFIS